MSRWVLLICLAGSCFPTEVRLSTPAEAPREGVRPGECLDKEDNDDDGLVDCLDKDCHQAPSCIEDTGDADTDTDTDTDTVE
ncbi:MAG: hypothetical protein HN348_15185 [Proteobacteria bacterium]|jgi:hypothetical protein|nr:hypothetical protein [Pseudomonadota bacterium]